MRRTERTQAAARKPPEAGMIPPLGAFCLSLVESEACGDGDVPERAGALLPARSGVERRLSAMNTKQDNKLILTSPVTGWVASLGETPDTYFASGLMGAGVVLYPREGRLLAPCDGVVDFVFPKKYALGLRTQTGLEVVLQVGIDSNRLDSGCFQPWWIVVGRSGRGRSFCGLTCRRCGRRAS